MEEGDFGHTGIERTFQVEVTAVQGGSGKGRSSLP